MYYAVRNEDSKLVNLLLLNRASPWSTDSYDLNRMLKNNFKLKKMIKTARKLHLQISMT